MKDQLIFDTTNATTILASDSVGAFLRASDGTLLTHTDVGGKKALDVRVAEGINVEVDLSHADDSVKIGDGTDFLAIDGSGNIGVTDAGGSLTVDAVNLDIRDLAYATDSVTAYQGTSPWVIGDGGASISVDDNGSTLSIDDGGGSITVDGTLAVTQGTSPWVVSDAALAVTAIANAAETLDVASTAQNIIVAPLANRKHLWIYNNDNQKMYIGATGVTAANGFPISPASYVELRAGAAVDIEFVSAKLNHEIRTLELS